MARRKYQGAEPELPASKPLPAGEPTSAQPTKGMPSPPQPSGRDGKRRTYIEQLFERRGEEDHSDEVMVAEKLVSDCPGRVDIRLKDDSPLIACEISVASTAEHHAAPKARRRLAAVCGHVLMIATDKKALGQVNAAVAVGSHANQGQQIQVLVPAHLFASVAAAEMKTAPSVRVADDQNQLLTAKEVEEFLRIDVKTIYSYVQKGLIPYVKIQSNVRFIRSEILKWVEERQFKPAGRGSRK